MSLTSYQRGWAARRQGHDFESSENESWQSGWRNCDQQMRYDEAEHDTIRSRIVRKREGDK